MDGSIEADLRQRPIRELRTALARLGYPVAHCIERSDFVTALLEASTAQLRSAIGKSSDGISDQAELIKLLLSSKPESKPESAATSSPTADARSQQGAYQQNAYAAAYASAASSKAAAEAVKGDGERWGKMGPKATICFLAYAAALFIAVISAGGVFPPYQALVVLTGAFVLELLAKYGLKFNSGYLQSLLRDDVGVMPMMSITLLTPGLHPFVRTLAMAPHFTTALLSFAQICKFHMRIPLAIRDFFSPLAESYARYRVMQARADAEVGLGFILIAAVFSMQAAPISVFLYWNFMMMRYMMSPFTQASFRKVDGFLFPVVGNVPILKDGYGAIKRGLYSFVDPQSNRRGSMCSIL